MFLDFGVSVNANDEVVAHQLGLPERVGMPEVDHVVATVAPHTDLRIPAIKLIVVREKILWIYVNIDMLTCQSSCDMSKVSRLGNKLRPVKLDIIVD